MSGRVRTIITIVVVLLVGGWAVRATARSVYLGPRAERLGKIEDVREKIDRYRTSLDDAARVEGRLASYADRTLGSDLEGVDHHLRTRLNRIGEDVGLDDVTVGTGVARDRLSPARNEFRGPYADLRDEVDLVELDGWINGEGTLEQAMRLLDVIEAEPWMKRIDQYKLESRENGARLGVSVRLTTVFLPDRAPSGPAEAAYDPAPFGRFVTLIERNPFGLPAPPVEAASAPAPAPRGAPASRPQWRLTGITHGPSGSEVWLKNERTGASRRMAIGDRIRDIVLVEINDGDAVFTIGEQRYGLSLGETLRDRSGPGQ